MAPSNKPHYGIGYTNVPFSQSSRGKSSRKATVKFVQASVQGSARKEATVQNCTRPSRKFRKIVPLRITDFLIFRRLIKSLHALKIKRAKCAIEKTPTYAYFKVVYTVNTVPYTLRINIDKAYMRKRSIGGVRAFIRSRVACSLGRTRSKPDYILPERKQKPSPAQLQGIVLARIQKRARIQAELTRQAFEHCKCYMIYFPELWPQLKPNPDGLTDSEFGAGLRYLSPLKLKSDAQYYQAVAEKHPPFRDEFVIDLKLRKARISDIVRLQKLPYLAPRKAIDGTVTLADHSKCLDYERYLPLSLQVGDWQLGVFDDDWED
jgi:hypothetical protein